MARRSPRVAGTGLALLAQLTRGGVVESTHVGAVAVAGPQGTVVGGLGDIDALVYARSALKPFQALAACELLETVGLAPPSRALAIACASHGGEAWHQIEAAHLLALAGLDESALRCPTAWPVGREALCEQTEPTPLAHNCSGKHAAFLWAHTATGGEPAGYLDVGSPLQQRVRGCVAAVTGAPPTGPGIDGCGAPAWRLSLARLATGYAHLAAASDGLLARIRAAMTAHPELIGGPGSADVALMSADGRLVAKRGAEGVLAAGFARPRGAVGVAAKVADGSHRGSSPAVAAVLGALGASVPGELLRTPWPVGGRSRAWLEASPALLDWAGELGT